MQSSYKGYYLEEGENGKIYVYASADAWRDRQHLYVADGELQAMDLIDNSTQEPKQDSASILRELSFTDAFPILKRSFVHYNTIYRDKDMHRDALSVLGTATGPSEELDPDSTNVILVENDLGYIDSFLAYFVGYIYNISDVKEKIMEITYLASFEDRASLPILLRAVRVARAENVTAIQGEPLNEKVKQMYAKAGFIQSEGHEDSLDTMYKYL